MKAGIAITNPGHSMEDGDFQYNSVKNRLQVNVKETPKHLDVFKSAGGTSWTVPSSTTYTEDLVRIPHKMPFTPDYLVYFLCIDAPVLSANAIGSYYLNIFQMATTDILYAHSDETNFYITHQTENPIIGGTMGSDAGSFVFRIKYMILNTHSTK